MILFNWDKVLPGTQDGGDQSQFQKCQRIKSSSIFEARWQKTFAHVKAELALNNGTQQNRVEKG